jgi:hypothetical protein
LRTCGTVSSQENWVPLPGIISLAIEQLKREGQVDEYAE